MFNVVAELHRSPILVCRYHGRIIATRLDELGRASLGAECAKWLEYRSVLPSSWRSGQAILPPPFRHVAAPGKINPADARQPQLRAKILLASAATRTATDPKTAVAKDTISRDQTAGVPCAFRSLRPGGVPQSRSGKRRKMSQPIWRKRRSIRFASLDAPGLSTRPD